MMPAKADKYINDFTKARKKVSKAIEAGDKRLADGCLFILSLQADSTKRQNIVNSLQHGIDLKFTTNA